MNNAFLSILNISITASLVAVAVLLLRLGMKKAPKWISAALWAFVGARLVFPFAPQSRFSLIPSIDIFSVNQTPSAETFKVHTGVGAVNSVVNNHIAATESSKAIISALDVFSYLWVAGIIAFLLYGIISYLAVYLKVCTAIPLKDNIYQSENVKSPFVLGFIKPRIIVPFNLDDETLKNVILHENAHLKRKDHLVKPFAYLLLCFHWFNPLMWLSYILLCRDIEVACDEKVIKKLTFSERKTYALALLNCKVKNTTVAVCPVAFGEVSVKARIKNTLSYKKPAMWVIIAAITVSVIASGCLLTNPKAETIYVKTTITEEPQANSEPSTAPVSTQAAYFEAVTEAKTEVTTAETIAVTEPEETEIEYEAETEYSEEPQNKWDIQIDPSEIQGFDEYYNEVIQPQIEAEIMQKRYETLKKETINHSDSCECSNCDELRRAGIYPPIVVFEVPETNVAEYTMDYTEGEEYYYYEYETTSSSEYVELSIPTLNN